MAGIKEACGVFGIYDLDGNDSDQLYSAAVEAVSSGADLCADRSGAVRSSLCDSGAAFDGTV